MCSFYLLRADIRRRELHADPQTLASVAAIAGIIGAKLYHVLESPRELMESPAELIFSRTGFAWAGGLLAGAASLILLARRYKIKLLTMLDVCSPAAALGYAVGRIGCLISGDGDYGTPTSLPWGMSFPNGIVPTTDRVHPTPIYEFLVGLLIFWFLWKLGAKSLKGPHPPGQVAAAYFILSGTARFLVEFIRINPRSVLGLTNAQIISLLSIVGGAVLLIVVTRRFRAVKAEHRIIRHIQEKGDVLQKEYHRATPECPHPELWRMYDSMTAEYEVLEFLRSLVTTLKPRVVVETGTFSGISALWIAQGLKQNGFGRVVTCENDPAVFKKAKSRIQASGLGGWVDCRNQSSLQVQVDGNIDILFSDSDPEQREAEVRRFLTQMSPFGLIVMHDASSHLKVVREAALRMQSENLISVLLLPTPRGLVLAQKKQAWE